MQAYSVCTLIGRLIIVHLSPKAMSINLGLHESKLFEISSNKEKIKKGIIL
jgi:hypothetical protein